MSLRHARCRGYAAVRYDQRCRVLTTQQNANESAAIRGELSEVAPASALSSGIIVKDIELNDACLCRNVAYELLRNVAIVTTRRVGSR